MELKLQSHAMKASVVLDPAALAGIEVPNGLSKVTLRVAMPGRTIVAEVNAKEPAEGRRRHRHGRTRCVAVVLQGKLEEDNRLIAAGVADQHKTPMPTPTN